MLVDLYNQIIGDSGTEKTFYLERCTACAHCKICKLMKKKPTDPQIAISEQVSIKNSIVFSEK